MPLCVECETQEARGLCPCELHPFCSNECSASHIGRHMKAMHGAACIGAFIDRGTEKESFDVAKARYQAYWDVIQGINKMRVPDEDAPAQFKYLALTEDVKDDEAEKLGWELFHIAQYLMEYSLDGERKVKINTKRKGGVNINLVNNVFLKGIEVAGGVLRDDPIVKKFIAFLKNRIHETPGGDVHQRNKIRLDICVAWASNVDERTGSDVAVDDDERPTKKQSIATTVQTEAQMVSDIVDLVGRYQKQKKYELPEKVGGLFKVLYDERIAAEKAARGARREKKKKKKKREAERAARRVRKKKGAAAEGEGNGNDPMDIENVEDGDQIEGNNPKKGEVAKGKRKGKEEAEEGEAAKGKRRGTKKKRKESTTGASDDKKKRRALRLAQLKRKVAKAKALRAIAEQEAAEAAFEAEKLRIEYGVSSDDDDDENNNSNMG